MSTLAAKYTRLKTMIGGNREKMHYEETFGMPMEEFYRVTMPNPAIRRILGELEFSMKLSADRDNKYDADIEAALDYLQAQMDKDGVLTKDACLKAEEKLMVIAPAAKEYELILAAHAHIDMNWMWGWQETVASTVATFQTMLKLMDEYPDFHFSQSQASVYKIIEDYAPELKPQMEQRIKEGRWEITASAWVETDKNMPSTASLLNHIFYTRKYLHEHWGVDPKSLDLDFSPDTFGHSANLPELDIFGGVKYYYHCRGLDGNNALYLWKSPSGSEVLVYREQYWYNSGMTPLPAIGLIDVSKRSGGLKTGLMVYGVGDHGGGPTRRDLERAIEMQSWPVFPKMTFGTFHDYFKAAEAVRGNLPVVDHEMNYFSPGCYTTQSRIKLGNRHCEAALYDAQFNDTIAASICGTKYDTKQYESAWQNVLFTHFHDILTGSCVQETREHAMGLFAHSMAVAGTRNSLAMQSISRAIDTSMVAADTNIANSQSEGAGAGYGIENFSGIPAPERGSGMTRIFHLFNTASRSREQCAEITVWDWTGDLRRIKVCDVDGNALPFELLDSELKQYWDHKFFRILVKAATPAFGYTTIVLSQEEPKEYLIYMQPESRNNHPYNDIVLENDSICAKFSFRNGALVSFVDKATGLECLKPGQTGGLRLITTEHKSSNAWQIGRYISVRDDFETASLTAFDGSLRKGFTMEQTIGNSTVKATISLTSGDSSIAIELEADWHEITKNGSTVPVLVYLLPLKSCSQYMYDVPAGAVKRGAMEMDVPAQTYAAAMLDTRAVYITTDCKYGYRANEDGLIATLINAAHYPDPYPERGIHKIKLHIGSASNCAKGLHELAFAANHAISYQPGYSHSGTLSATASLLPIECGSAVVSEVSRRDNSLMVSLYETCGKDTTVALALPEGIKSVALTDFDGNVATTLEVVNNTISFPLGQHKMTMLKLD